MKGRMTILLLAALLLLNSCQRRPFAERTTGVDLRLRINTSIVNNSDVVLPETMRVDLFDPVTGALIYNDYVSPTGGYIYPEPGVYDLIVYNIGTETTLIRNEAKYSEVEAYTNDVSTFLKAQLSKFLASRAKAKAEREQARQEALAASKTGNVDTSAPPVEERIIYEPDHLFVGHVSNVEIPVILLEDETRELVIEVDAHTVVETWKVSVTNVIGLEWVQSVVAIMSGQVESTFIGKDEDSQGVASVYFEMYKDEVNECIAGRFNTFGKHPEELSELSFDVNITDTGGEEHHFHFDVTSDFFDNPTNYIVIDELIEIEEPQTGGGGFAPSVEDWENVNTDIIL